MDRRLFSTEAKVGAVVLVALGLLLALTFQIGKFSLTRSGYALEAVFRTVSGLDTKAKVRLAGVLVGEVERIYLEGGRAHVVLRLDEGTVVREDSVVSIAAIGILSEFYVDITAGTPGTRILAAGDVVEGKELVDLNQMVSQMIELSTTVKELARGFTENFAGRESGLGELLDRMTVLVERVDGLVAENRRSVAETLREGTGALREANAALREARGFLGENREDLRATIASLREFSATLGAHAEELSRQVRLTAEELRGAVGESRGDVRALVDSLRAAAAKADGAAASLASILAKVDGGTGSLGRLVNDEAPFAKVDRAAGQLEDAATKVNSGQGTLGRLVTDDTLLRQVESTVGKVDRILGDTDRLQFFLGFRGEYLQDQEALKSYATIKLQPRADKYYLFEVVGDPEGRRTITETTTQIDRPEGGYEISERIVTDAVSQLKFSLQFAKSFHGLTFRAGLIESQGGGAVDWSPLAGRVRLTFEGWDFAREEGAHLKFSARARLYKDLFLTGGVDDLAVEERRGWFLGAGILFSDEDLKSLLSLSRFVQ